LLPAATAVDEGIPLLRAPREGQDIVADYGSVGLTLRRHPLALLRDKLQRRGVVPTRELWNSPTENWCERQVWSLRASGRAVRAA